MKRIFDFISIKLLRLYRRSLRFPGLTIALFAILVFTAGFGFPRLRTLLAMEDLVSGQFPAKRNIELLKDRFQVHNSMRALLAKPASGWSRAELCALDIWLTKEQIGNSEIIQTSSLFNLRKTDFTGAYLHYPKIFQLDCSSVLTDRQANALPLDTWFMDAFKSPWGNVLIGPNAEYVLLDLELRDSDSTKYGSFNPGSIQDVQESFKKNVETRFSELKPFWIGAADFQYHLYVGLKRVSLLNILLLFILILSLRAAFGTWSSGVVFTGSLLVSGILLYGCMGILGAPVDILSKSLFMMMAVAALEDFFFLSTLQKAGGASWKSSFRKVLVPSFVTSLTTVLGFGSLCISRLEIIQRFGFWAAISAIIEWAVIFLLLPSLAVKIPFFRSWVKKGAKSFLWLEKLKQVSFSRKYLRAVAVLIPIVAILMVRSLNVQDVPNAMFPEAHPLRQGIALLKKFSGWENELSVVFPAEAGFAEIRGVLDEISKSPAVAEIKSPEIFQNFFKGNITDPGIRELISSEVRLSPFMESYFGKGSESRALLLLRESDTRSLIGLKNTVEQACKNVGCEIAGTAELYAEFSSLVPETLVESLGVSLILVSLVLFWLTAAKGKLAHLPSILLSSFWGTALMFVVMAAFKIRVNFLTCIFASVLVGLTGDNAIQYLFYSGRKSLMEGIRARSEASILCGFTMALASLVFLGSYFVPPRVFGILLAGGFLASLVGDFWLLKGLLD